MERISEINPVRVEVAVASNRVLDVAKALPGGELHARAMQNLVDLLAQKPEAISALRDLQR